jgi:hypothetical protein
MADQTPGEAPKSGYGSKWKKYVLIYVVVGAVAYFLVYLLFFHKGGGGY